MYHNNFPFKQTNSKCLHEMNKFKLFQQYCSGYDHLWTKDPKLLVNAD